MTKQIEKETEEIEKLLARISSGHNPKRPLSMQETAQGLAACYLNALALLEDTRLLAGNQRAPRALSLTILALEELAKVPDLFAHCINPLTRDDSIAWADFWRRWRQHQPKQERIAAYGNFLRDSASLDEAVFHNPTPYAGYLGANAYGHLDALKQRNFYVDFSDSRFQRPEPNRETCTLLDFLFSFAEERADSFGSWHITVQRSLDFLSVRAATFPAFVATGKPVRIGFNDWASTHEPIEAAADLLRLLCYHSSAIVPNYFDFYDACEEFLSKKQAPERIRLVRRVVAALEQRMKIEALPKSVGRAYFMLKLLRGYSTDHFSDTERQELFTDIA